MEQTPLAAYLAARKKYLEDTGWTRGDQKIGDYDGWFNPKFRNGDMVTDCVAVGAQLRFDGFMH